jgi:hypothetical protein
MAKSVRTIYCFSILSVSRVPAVSAGMWGPTDTAAVLYRIAGINQQPSLF